MRCAACGREGPAGECIGCGHWNDAVLLRPDGSELRIDKAKVAEWLGVPMPDETAPGAGEDPKP